MQILSRLATGKILDFSLSSCEVNLNLLFAACAKIGLKVNRQVGQPAKVNFSLQRRCLYSTPLLKDDDDKCNKSCPDEESK